MKPPKRLKLWCVKCDCQIVEAKHRCPVCGWKAKFEARTTSVNATARQKFEKALDELDENFKVWTDAIHESERLTEKDFAIRINV